MNSGADIAGAYWDAVCAMDADQVAARFADQATLRFGNTPAVVGRLGIRRTFVRLFAKTRDICCRSVAAWQGANCIVAEADLIMGFEDGGGLTIPVTAVFRTERGLIVECRVLFYPEPALEPPSLSGVC